MEPGSPWSLELLQVPTGQLILPTSDHSSTHQEMPKVGIIIPIVPYLSLFQVSEIFRFTQIDGLKSQPLLTIINHDESLLAMLLNDFKHY